ncbi:MAG: aryl-sulfate sulfotransferase [Myxococcales bacterium]|nr:aryl-sulfate sulfotransferase [Myxococcales bacterium]
MTSKTNAVVVALVGAVVFAGCDNNGNGHFNYVLPEVTFTVMDPPTPAPLTRSIRFFTNMALTPTVTVTGGGESFVVPASGFLSAEPAFSHHVMILGLKPATTYAVDVTMVGPGGATNTETIQSITTNPLPANFPPLEVRLANPARSNGVTLFDVFPSAINGAYFIAVDATGDVVWYLPLPEVSEPDIRRMHNGNLLFLAKEGEDRAARQINMLGETIAEVRDSDLHLRRFHHEMFEMENGHLLTYTIELRNLGPYLPENMFHDVVGENITEITWDGQVVNDLRTLDILDPFRRLPDFNAPFYNADFGGIPTKDWAHGNAIVHDPHDDTYILSLRHQDIVVKINRRGRIVWVLGQDFADTAGDNNWPFLTLLNGTYQTHQHAVEVIGENQIILYDNANNSGGASRAVIYSIDPVSLTATQDYEYVDPTFDPPLCAPFVGDADLVPGADGAEHVLVAHMGASPHPAPCGVGPDNYILITEVDRQTKEKVFEIQVRDPDPAEGESAAMTNGYRAERLPSLYP